MLDANNFIPSWETGDGEKVEVSTALINLREEYDLIHKKAMKMDMDLLQTKADIKKAKEEEKRVSKDFGGATEDIEKSIAELDHLSKTHDF